MSKSQRDKGARVEREIVNAHREMGVYAERVPLSGAAGFRGAGYDVDIYAFGRENAPLVSEVKARKDGSNFATLEKWLGENDLLFLRRNNSEPMVTMPWRVWERIVQLLNRQQTGDYTNGKTKRPPSGDEEVKAPKGL